MPKASSFRINSSSNWNLVSFQMFFEGWLVRQEHYLDELISTETDASENDLRDLIERVLGHYQQYYKEKSLLAKKDVYLLFSPIWFSSLEKSFLWITGFKPGLAIRIVSISINDLTEEQLQKINRLRLEIKEEERELDEDLAKIQESLAAQPFLEMARRLGRVSVNEETSNEVESSSATEEGAMETLRSSMEILVQRADYLRLKTISKVLEILNSVQTVRFFTAATKLQLRIRKLGFQRDSNTNL